MSDLWTALLTTVSSRSFWIFGIVGGTVFGLLFVIFRYSFPASFAEWNRYHRGLTARQFWAYWVVLVASQVAAGVLLNVAFPGKRSTITILAMLPLLALISRFTGRSARGSEPPADITDVASAGDRTRIR